MALLNIWSLGHFIQWTFVGRFLFSNWYLFLVLSIGWELLELVLPYEFAIEAWENKISDIIKIVQKNLDKKVKIVKKNERVRPSKSEVIRLRCNNNYIIKNSSWKPRITLEKGILNTTEWIKKNVSKEIISKYIV